MPAFLIALPSGLITSGVAAWAARTAGALAHRGHDVGLILHAGPAGHAPLPTPIDPRVRVTDLTHLPPLESGVDPDLFLPHYLDAIDALPGPVVLSPNLHGDCYALAAAATLHRPIHLLGWLHNDIPYDYHLQRHYEPVLARFVAVSRHIESRLAAELPGRRDGIRRIAYGVEVPPAAPARAALTERPLRLVYSGRMELAQKRVLALPFLSRALDDTGIHHELVLVGDGPASGQADRALAGCKAAWRLPAMAPHAVLRLLDAADVLVLPSRHEGLSVSVIEAMSRGCVPVVTRTASGAAELIDDGRSGVLVDAPDDNEGAGKALAAGVARALPRLPNLSAAAHAAALAHYSLGPAADRIAALLAEVTRESPRRWPTQRPWRFTDGGGSVPPDGPRRLADLLESLAGRRVLIHGTGRHTQELAPVFAQAPCDIAAFADDDPGRHGTTLWGRPVIAPPDARTLALTDVIISSWINHESIWSRRAVYEAAGLRVHALYPPTPAAPGPTQAPSPAPRTPPAARSATPTA